MLITTSFDFPGYDIIAMQGECFGLTVRSRNIGAGCIAGFRSIGGGEIPEFTNLLSKSRNEAMARMVEEAQRRGANGIIGMRFDSGAIGQWSEICAYGTAVSIVPVSDIAQKQYEAMVQVGQMPHQQTYASRISEWADPNAPQQQPPMPGQPLPPQQPAEAPDPQAQVQPPPQQPAPPPPDQSPLS